MKQGDIEIIRRLASKYMEYAVLPVQKEKRQLWEALNGCEMERPLILFDQLPWHEMDVDGFLVNEVEDPYWREVETGLRQQIYKWEKMPADMVLNPYITLQRPIDFTGYGIKIQEETLKTDSASSVLSHHYINQFIEMEDIYKIKTPRAILDKDKELLIRQQADMIFDGILEYKMNGIMLNLGFWEHIAMWMSVDQIYIDLIDRPELFHGIIERMTACTIEAIEQINKERLFADHNYLCHCSHTYEKNFPPESADFDNLTSHDVWGTGLAQVFTMVSPKVTKEFEVQYMKRLFPYFGRIYYGCCDRLDDRLEYILEMPNVRKISCSPWSDREFFASKLPHNYIMSQKPNPAFFATESFDIDTIRQDISLTFQTAKNNNTNLELIFKDVSTVGYQPQRLWETAKMATDMANNY